MPEPVSEERLAEIEARALRAAVRRPLYPEDLSTALGVVQTDVPDLIAEVRRIRERVAELDHENELEYQVVTAHRESAKLKDAEIARLRTREEEWMRAGRDAYLTLQVYLRQARGGGLTGRAQSDSFYLRRLVYGEEATRPKM